MKIDLPKRNIVFQAGFFRAYLTFMECIFHFLLLIFVYRKLTLCGPGEKKRRHTFSFIYLVPIVKSIDFLSSRSKTRKPMLRACKFHASREPIGWLKHIFKWARISLEGFQSWFTKFDFQHITRWMKNIRRPAILINIQLLMLLQPKDLRPFSPHG